MSSFSSSSKQSSRRTSALGGKLSRGVPQGRDRKRWNKVFSKPRVCIDRTVCESHFNWIDIAEDENEAHSDVDGTSNILRQPEDGERRPSERELTNMLLGDSEVSDASWETKALVKFLSRRDDEALVAEDDQAWAWVDDREISVGRSRDYLHRLDARGLQDILKEPRFEHPTLPNVDQRMIYISKLTPSFVASLVKTDWYHQTEALRDAIRKHVALESSLRVHVQTLGFDTYRLEFHMAHLILRRTPQATNATTNESIANLSFLDLANADGQVVPHSIYQGHMSLVICGWSDLQWTGYAFTRDENGSKEIVETDKLRRHITSQYGFDLAKPAQSAQLWDARRYWLHLVARHSQYALREWQYLIRTIEEGIEAWDPCNIAAQSSILGDDIKKSLDKTVQTMQLLQQLLDALSVTLRAYKRFAKPDGDKCYFLGISDCSYILDTILESFEKLEDLSLRLVSLDNSCKRFATHLERLIELENNRLIMQTNQLDQESNAHHAASNRLYERINKLSEQNVVLTKEMRELSKRNAEAACANQVEALKTSRSTRVNIELLLLTTPLLMVLQYFSSVKEILFFEPSPTSLVLATLVLMVLLRLLALAFQHGGTLLRLIFRKPYAHRTTSQLPVGNQINATELQEIRNP